MRIKPLVSIVIPTYNSGKYLVAALSSALEQTYDARDIIVVDDGSTDDTPEIMATYNNRYAMRYIRINRSGASHARNIGIREARGDYVAFLDADDMWFRDKLEKQLPLFLNMNVGVVYSRATLINEEGHEMLSNHDVCKLYRGDVLNRILIGDFTPLSSLVLRRKCFDEVGLFDETLDRHEDYDLKVRMAARYDYDYVNAPLIKHRVHPDQRSKNTEAELNTVWGVLDKNLNDNEIRKKLHWKTPKLAKASIYRMYACSYFSEGYRLKSITCYIKSIMQFPLFWLSWVGIIRCMLPDIVIRSMKKNLTRGSRQH